MKLLFESNIQSNFLTIKARFNRELFLNLIPVGVKVDLARFDGCKVHDEIHISVSSMGIKQQWVSVITSEKQNEKEWSFVDEGKLLPWPLASWKHHHRVLYLDDNSSKIIDDITFECVHSWMNALMYPVLWSTFAIRPARYRKYFQG